jgi:ribose transport system ATP-binding protein
MEHVSKRFGDSYALQDASLTVRAGEVHALVGQNGSGKSTLIKILAGYHMPEDGAEAQADGRPLRLPPSPHDLRAANISFVHQDLGLVDDFTIAENICVAHFETVGLGHIVWGRQRAIAAEVMERLGVEIDPNRRVGTLTPSERATVAIGRGLRAQSSGNGVIVLDEATRALPQDSLQDVYAVVRRFCASGGSIIMISHNLDEVMELADCVTVLRDGRVVTAGIPTEETSQAGIARTMLGYDLEHVARRASAAAGQAAAIQVAGLSGASIADMDLTVHKGEIVGVTGLAGSGFEAIPYLIAGATRPTAGSVTLGDGSVLRAEQMRIQTALRAGIALVPERRERDGLSFEMTVADNITLPRENQRGRPWYVGSQWRANEVRAAVERLGIKPPNPEAVVRGLSGGNQQKVMLAKWLAGEPRLLVMHEPTQAVDVGARREILMAIADVADSGVGVLIASLEASDLAAICDRVVVIREGRIGAVLDRPDAETILRETYAPMAHPGTGASS